MQAYLSLGEKGYVRSLHHKLKASNVVSRWQATSTTNSVMIEHLLLVYVRHDLITIFKRMIIMLHTSQISQALWVVDNGATHHIALRHRV